MKLQNRRAFTQDLCTWKLNVLALTYPGTQQRWAWCQYIYSASDWANYRERGITIATGQLVSRSRLTPKPQS